MSDDLLGFEPVDDELRRRLGAAAPAPGDPETALRELTPRYRRARRRHQAVTFGGGAIAMVAAVAVVLAVAVPRGGDGRVRVPAAASTRPPVTTAPSPPAPTVVPAPPLPSPAATDTGAGTAPAATAAETPTPTSPAAPEQHTYSSTGGSVTVRFTNGALSIVSTAPAAGFTEERHDTGPDRVEVRFSDGDVEWRVRVDVVDGRPVEDISRH